MNSKFWMLAIFVMITLKAHASGGLEPYTYLYNGKTITAKIGESEGVRVNDVCLKDTTHCAALLAIHAPSRMAEVRKAKDGNFSGAYCELLKGTQIFLQGGQKQAEAQFCVFADLTLIDAKVLYQRHTLGKGKKP